MTSPTAAQQTSPDWARLGRLVILLVGSTAAATAVAFAIGFAAFASSPRGDGEWDELGAALWGLIAGFAAGVTSFVVAVTVGVRWAVAPGRRLATAVTVLGLAIVGPLAVAHTATAADRGGMAALGVVVALVVATAVIALVGLVADAVPARRAVQLSCLAGVAVVLTTVLGAVRGPAMEEAARVARYERADVPLALVDGTTVAPPANGWSVQHVAEGWSPDDVTITYRVPSSSSAWSRVDLHLERDPEQASCERPRPATACARLGTRDDGATIWGDPLTGYGTTGNGPTGSGRRTAYNAVWVDVPGGRWRLRGTSYPQPLDPDDAVAILTALQPVDATTFAAAT